MPISSSPGDAYQAYILPLVSRTFALTIPQLPGDLCRVVGNAYLLCRIADTIEDDPALGIAQKARFSDEFIGVVAGTRDAGEFARQLAPLLGPTVLNAEKDLIRHTPQVVGLTHTFSFAQRQAILRCVRIMGEGMAEFQRRATSDGLADVPELDRYCYHVAGVVGEMLTSLFCEHSPAIARHGADLHALARSFGQGLQMTNILKDLWEDRQRGACWLPRSIFAQAGFDLRELRPAHPAEAAFQAGLGQLLGLARAHLQQALEYVLLIPRQETGIRRFCLYALGMAVLTLRRIDRNRSFHSGRQVKISRRSVGATLFLADLLTRRDTALRLLFAAYTRRLPRTSLARPVDRPQ